MKPTFVATWVLGLGMAFFLSPAWAKHGPTVTEFNTPTPDSLAEGVEVTRDGSRKVTITVTDECPIATNPKCKAGHIDLCNVPIPVRPIAPAAASAPVK